jgi:CRISPR-associated endonuclease/helicase Cas3
MAAALVSLRTSDQEASDADTDPIAVGLLRGGITRNNPTLLDPSVCAVVSATPDMWGSRMLFRGYGASCRARPREAAVTAYDSVMVLDESHLNRQLLVTARRIAELVNMEKNLGIPTLQVVETTATPTKKSTNCVEIGPEDLVTDIALADRIRASKPLVLQASENWLKHATGKRSNKQLIVELSDAVRKAVQDAATLSQGGSRTVGCIVNRVNTAVDLADTLKKTTDLEVKILVGRMRPADLVVLRNEHADLFTVKGDAKVDVLVATQTLEVGVDVDFAALVTELASASALTQRFGRVNRLGRRTETPVTVLVPDTAPKKDCLPYTVQDLDECLTWLRALAEGPASVSPENLATLALPQPSRRRVLYQRPEWSDINRWSRTGDQLFADDDLELWLRDDLEPEKAQAGIVVREGLPKDDLTAIEVLRAAPPLPTEEFPAKIQIVRELIDNLLDGTSGKDAVPRAFLFHDGVATLITVGDSAKSVQPGDTLVVDYGARFTTAQVAVSTREAKDIPVPVTTGVPTLYAPAEERHGRDEQQKDSCTLRRSFIGLDADAATELWRAAAMGRDLDTVILPLTVPDDADKVPWFLVKTQDVPADDAPVRQQWTSAPEPVTLQKHSEDVAHRAQNLASSVGLLPDFVATVTTAGLHHDDGKVDDRFQAMLEEGAEGASEPLAKSTGVSRRQGRGAAGRGGLPVGWRHEQYSAVLSEKARLQGEDTVNDLVVRLVGTSHGHGRSGFPHVGAELLPASASIEERDIAEHLFTTGRWDELVEDTAVQTGHYAVSYLEAIVRAADNQISKEGR